MRRAVGGCVAIGIAVDAVRQLVSEKRYPLFAVQNREQRQSKPEDLPAPPPNLPETGVEIAADDDAVDRRRAESTSHVVGDLVERRSLLSRDDRRGHFGFSKQ
jgi:hypothetical protein